MGKVERVTVVVEELIVVVNVGGTEVEGERCGAVVLADTVFNVFVIKVL